MKLGREKCAALGMMWKEKEGKVTKVRENKNKGARDRVSLRMWMSVKWCECECGGVCVK